MNEEGFLNFKKRRREDCLIQNEFDEKYKTDTTHPVTIDAYSGIMLPGITENSHKYPGSSGFQNTPIGSLKQINEYISSNFDISKYTFLDLGCGKARSLVHNIVTNAGYKDNIGIEIDEDLYKIACNNASIIGGITVLNEDIINYKVPYTPLVILVFNPCDIDIYDSFLKNNKFHPETIIVSTFGYTRYNPDTGPKTDNPEVNNGFRLIVEEDFIFFYMQD